MQRAVGSSDFCYLFFTDIHSSINKQCFRFLFNSLIDNFYLFFVSFGLNLFQISEQKSTAFKPLSSKKKKQLTRKRQIENNFENAIRNSNRKYQKIQ